MNIAEFFVNLGIKGADVTVGALTNVKKGMGELSHASLEAKAGILAALYAFQQMMSMSNQAGSSLMNFAAFTGLSTKQLQQWQYAARQAGVSSEDFTGSIKGVQSAMSNLLLGKGAPEGFGIVKNAVGLDPAKLRDSFYVMGQLQKAAQALPKDVGNQVLKSFGLSEGTIAAMRRNAFNPNTLGKAPIYTERDIGQLDRANVAWSNLATKIEMAFGKFNARHGVQLVNDISKIVDAVVKLVEALDKLAEKLKVFQLLGKTLNLIADTVNSADVQIGAIQNPSSYQSKLEPGKSGYLQMWKDALSNDASRVKNFLGGSAANTTTVNQNIVHHGDAKDTKAVKDLHKTAINAAFRQRPNYVGN